MKKTIYAIASLLSVAGAIQGQTVGFDGDNYNVSNVNNFNIKGNTQSFDLEYPISEMKEITFSRSAIDFNKADKKTSGNEIKWFSFKMECNDGTILDYEDGKINGDEISVFIPYYEGGAIKASFGATGKVFVNGIQQKSGVSSNVYNGDVEYKVVDNDGNIHTYTVKVHNSGLPILRIDAPIDMASKVWNGDYPLTLTSAKGEILATATAQVKAKGGQNSLSSKREFNIKCGKKTAFIDMAKNKRWILLSNVDDASMLRAKVGFDLGKELTGMSWTPSSEFVEVVMGRHLGTYLLCEQVRVAEGRVKEDAVWEITDDIEADDVWFVSDRGTKVRLVDSSEDDASSEMEKAKTAINKFEAALYGGKSFDSYIDENSFVDWIWANEICKNEHVFKKDSYFRITTDGKIAMSPIFSNEKWLGNNGQSYEGFSTINRGWCEKMMQDADFSSAVCNRFKEIASTESVITSAIEEYKDLISVSAESNASIWGIKSSLSNEASSLSSWIKKRYSWLSTMSDGICKCAKADKASSNNEIKSFSIKKSSNGNALLEDYDATIANDSVKIFVPYLVDFNLQAEFSVASGAKVYCNGEEIESGKSTVYYLKPQHFKVVASNGDVRTYTVCIYNSGLPVIYLTTQGNKTISDKKTWLDNTQFTVYEADGTLNYDAAPDMAQVKGRGNSTWDASQEKRPYAVKLNKKSRILGMLEHKRWVLMANYYDATFFRNTMSNYLGKRFTNQDWVPSGYNAELVLNGAHKGNYYFCEQAKINDNRVHGEFLIEADIKAGLGNGAIEGPKSHNAFFTKDPELQQNSSDYNRVKDIIDKFESALYSGNYSALEKLIDLESFVDWYLIKEWSRDVDGNMHTSCYFTIMEDGTIKMGPMWDFDLAWGGNPLAGKGQSYNSVEGYYITTNPISQPRGATCTSWFGEFIKMPAFKSMLKEKVLDINSHLDEILAYIDENTEYLLLSATANKVGMGEGGMFGMFGGGGGWGGGWPGSGQGSSSSATTPESYRKSMGELKDYVKSRMQWFVNEVNKF